MIEEIIVNYLNSRLSVEANMERPEELQESYVLIERTGGGESNFIKVATIVIQSYATSLYQAAALNESVKEFMEELVLLDAIVKVKLNTDYNFTDPDTKEYRYQAVYEISYY